MEEVEELSIMPRVRLLSLHSVLLVMLFCVCPVRPVCSPAEEGQSTSIACTSDTRGCSGDRGVVLIWRAASSSGAVALCGKDGCDGTHPAIHATITSSSSVLTIDTVSRNHPLNMETKWTCTPCRGGQVTACNKLEIYAKPQGISCAMREDKESGDIKSVTVSCSTTRIYPKALCRFQRFVGGTWTTINGETTDNHPTIENSLVYYKSECSVTVPVGNLGVGTQRFQASLYPDVKDGIDLVTPTAVPGIVTLNSTEAFDFKAIRPGEDGSTSNHLEILCKFNITKTDYQTVSNMHVWEGALDATNFTTPIATFNSLSKFNSGGVTMITSDPMVNPTTVDLKFGSANGGYGKAYQCSVDVKDSDSFPRTFLSHIIRVVTCEESACVKTDVVHSLEERLNEFFLSPEKFFSNSKAMKSIKEKLTNISEKLSQENIKGIKSALGELKLAQEQENKILYFTVLSSAKDKYHVSDIYQGHIYIASKKAVEFDLYAINQECKDAGGYLVEFDDKDEQNFVKNFAKTTGDLRYYTGANDVDSEGTFVYYTSKKPVKNVSWMQGEPNNYEGNEGCVEIRSNGLNDKKCDRNGKYICEIPLFEA